MKQNGMLINPQYVQQGFKNVRHLQNQKSSPNGYYSLKEILNTVEAQSKQSIFLAAVELREKILLESCVYCE